MSMLLSENVLYVRTVEASRKQPPKMQRLSGRLREVVTYITRIEPQGNSSEKRSRHICFMEYNLSHAMSELGYVLFHVVTKVIRYSKYHSAHSANRE